MTQFAEYTPPVAEPSMPGACPQRVMEVIVRHPSDDNLDDVIWVLIFEDQREAVTAVCTSRQLKAIPTDYTDHVPGTDLDCRFDDDFYRLGQHLDSAIAEMAKAAA